MMPRFLMGKQRTTKYVITATNGSRNSQDSICELEKLKSLNREKEKKKSTYWLAYFQCNSRSQESSIFMIL